MKIGIIKETKHPSDSRVALTPQQCRKLLDEDVDLVVQKSDVRIFSDEEYQELQIPLVDQVDDCDVLLGVKEVNIENLIANKSYFFFSHTIKAQPYNRNLLQKVLQKNIRLVDWETLTDDQGKRLIAFGKFAGIVGAYNGILGYGKQCGQFELNRLSAFRDYAEAKQQYLSLHIPPIKIVLTGNGRVANGAAMVLDEMNIKKVSQQDFLNRNFNEPVYTQLTNEDYVKHKSNKSFDIQDFFKNPQDYISIFEPYTKVSNLMINGIFWDNKAPAFFTRQDMLSNEFTISFIADITCDIAPIASIPATIQASTISNPFFAYNPETNGEEIAFSRKGIDMMTIDNLPNELPRDASHSFGEQFLENIWPSLKVGFQSDILKRATIAENGKLTKYFYYLTEYIS